MRNQQQHHQTLLLLSTCPICPLYLISCFLLVLLHALLLNAQLAIPMSAPSTSTSCFASTNRSIVTCSSTILDISFPFLTSDDCQHSNSSFVISNCDPSSSSSHPDWPGFTKHAINDSHLNHSYVIQMYIPPLSAATNYTNSSSNNKSTIQNLNPFQGYINLTWSPKLPDHSNDVCTQHSYDQIGEYIPSFINLQDFAHSAFNFDPSNIILLFSCNTTLAETTSNLNRNSSACMVYDKQCKLNNTNKEKGYNCYQYTIPNPRKELNLTHVMSISACKQAMFFVSLNSSLPVSNWTRGMIRLNWNATGTGLIASTLHSCKDCLARNGSCGYNSTDNFECYCPNCTMAASRSPQNVPTPSPNGASYKQGLGMPKSTNNRRTVILVAGSLAVALIMLLVLLALFCFHKRKKEGADACSSLERNKSWIKRPSFLSRKQDPILAQEISYQELISATENFAGKHVLANGGFGAVYWGIIGDGLKVAVKRLHHDKNRRTEHFYNEIKVLSNLSHPNLVKLYGFCVCDDERELLLVFEYASQGTVSDHLHGGLKPPMSWGVRLNIASETADALSYLHNAVNPPIYHRDVKTANILLDDGFHVKLADFGLSKLVPMKESHISTSPQGTPGYLDPEYHQCYQLTDKSDVFSLGVVLMELISGKQAVDMSRERGEVNLSAMAVMKIQGGLLEELVDPQLEMKKDPSLERSIKRVVELAFECVNACSDDRPSMKSVAETLLHIRREQEEALQQKPTSTPTSIFLL